MPKNIEHAENEIKLWKTGDVEKIINDKTKSTWEKAGADYRKHWSFAEPGLHKTKTGEYFYWDYSHAGGDPAPTESKKFRSKEDIRKYYLDSWQKQLDSLRREQKGNAEMLGKGKTSVYS